MNSKKKLLVTIIALVVLLGGAYLLYTKLGETMTPDQLGTQANQGAENEKQEKISAPDIMVYDYAGNKVYLSDYIGKPVVLNFWASWCGPCQMEMPAFQEKYLELGEEIQFLMVNVTDGSKETLETASSFTADQKYTFPVFYDTDSNAAITYGVYSLPMTFFIDSEGNIAAHASGVIDSSLLQKGIDSIYS